MRTRNLIFALCSAVLIMAMASCSSCSKEEKPAPQQTRFEQGMTAEDTAAVEELIDEFFQYAIDKKFADAAAMLYRYDKKRTMPELLNNEEMADVRTMLRSFPMVDYRIEYMKFSKSDRNEVLCYVIMKRAEGNMPEISTKMFFKPVRYMHKWYLCLMNTEYSDRSIVDPDKRDSMKADYKSKTEKKEQPAQK